MAVLRTAIRWKALGVADRVMAIWHPSRRILASPAWLWVVLAIPLFLLTNLIPKRAFIDRDVWPSQLSEPPDRSAIDNENIIVARAGDSFRFVPVDKRDHAARRVDKRDAATRSVNEKPRWHVFVYPSNHKEESFSCGASGLMPGLIRTEASWTYALRANRVDRGFWMEVRENGLDWKGDKENPYELSPEQVQKLTPLLVAELNRRHPGTKLGDRLEKMLDDGLEVSSMSYPPQNALILLRWLALLMAVAGFCSMFVRPRAVSVPRVALPMSQNEVLLIKIAGGA
jgi:hypothetical protein